MASVSDILNIAGKVANMRASNAETDIALNAMNNAYLRACLDTELTGADCTYTTTSTAESLAASAIAGTGVHRVQHLRLTTGGQRIPLQQVSRQELQDNRATDDVSGVPTMYSVAMVNGTPTVDFWPNIGSGDVIRMSYLASPLPLATAVTTAGTTALTYLPEMFHHDIVTNAAIGGLLERAGKFDEAQLWHAKSLEGISRLEEYLGQMGGTANRAYFGPSNPGARYPDTHRR